MDFPEEFRKKMKALLGEEFTAFAASYDRPRRRALRVNCSKITPEEFAALAPFPVERIPWVDNGFFYPDTVRPARHPYYAAGLYYLQEPSAMTPASRLPLEAGDKVLDLCAAPGGKATELAERLTVLDRERERKAAGDESRRPEQEQKSVLVANDVSQQRAKALLRNLEMTGTDNYCVLHETPERLSAAFPQYFDKILVDAPCSGEGMFRKEEEALRLWSPQRVEEFAAQQKKILARAYEMLRPGGLLLYSTCTFSPEENEQQIADFLTAHPDMCLQEITPYTGFAQGMSVYTAGQAGCTEEGPAAEEIRAEDPLQICRCVRIWPHKMDGEGHFLALLKKTASDEGKDAAGSEGYGRAAKERKRGKRSGADRRKAAAANRPDREQRRLLKEFFCDIVGDTVTAEAICGCVELRQGRAVLPGAAEHLLHGLHVLRGGRYLGDWKKNRFEPAQALAVRLQPGKGDCRNRQIALSADDSRLQQYLCGEPIRAEELPDGWALICADGFPVGWAKVVQGTAKNHYPASWRMTAIP